MFDPSVAFSQVEVRVRDFVHPGMLKLLQFHAVLWWNYIKEFRVRPLLIQVWVFIENDAFNRLSSKKDNNLLTQEKKFYNVMMLITQQKLWIFKRQEGLVKGLGNSGKVPTSVKLCMQFLTTHTEKPMGSVVCMIIIIVIISLSMS